MATYAVGDIQGCYKPLKCLLKKVNFDPARDCLWAAGDLVNRGPKSLKVLRFFHELGDSARVVLGNHDLHLIAVSRGHKALKKSDSLEEILAAPDHQQLITWLRHQPLIHHDKGLGYCMVHAGIPPIWSLKKAKRLAREVETVLQDDQHIDAYLQAMYGNKPAKWRDDLHGMERMRVITNYLTRMRLCKANGKLDLDTKEGGLDYSVNGYAPWFLHPARKAADKRILFGHWAALMGEDGGTANIFPLDTGCVWGGRLRMMCLDDGALFECSCR